VLRYVRGKAAVKGSQVFVLPQVSPPCPQAETSSRRLCLQAGHPRRSCRVLISQRSAHPSEVVLFKCVSSSLRGWRLFRILLIVGVPTLKLCSEIRNPVQDTRLPVPSLERHGIRPRRSTAFSIAESIAMLSRGNSQAYRNCAEVLIPCRQRTLNISPSRRS
jgi:hypothetical protein